MKRFLLCGLLAASAVSAAPPPANVAMQNGTSRAVQPMALIGPSGDLVGSSSTIATAQVPVTTSPTLLAIGRPGRQRIQVTVTSATACFIGPSTVTTTTGFPLAPVAFVNMTINTAASVYAVCTASATLGVTEEY